MSARVEEEQRRNSCGAEQVRPEKNSRDAEFLFDLDGSLGGNAAPADFDMADHSGRQAEPVGHVLSAQVVRFSVGP